MTYKTDGGVLISVLFPLGPQASRLLVSEDGVNRTLARETRAVPAKSARRLGHY
jgi:hypothetical protein